MHLGIAVIGLRLNARFNATDQKFIGYLCYFLDWHYGRQQKKQVKLINKPQRYLQKYLYFILIYYFKLGWTLENTLNKKKIGWSLQ